MKPIWYFVGLILLIMGGIIFLNGIYQALYPETVNTVLKETHPSLWWGAVMVIFGAVMFFKTKNQSV
ncbi:hypothetical protein ACSSWA_06960 [Melioribacter sp. Ez-97]|jgi:uncharacterized membrane protein|uniref:hypothetical protein n=1 Tax=Melioribacter sp. Ez-97 TaxID=3423434 RepID=UPI003EDABD17